MKLVNYRCKDCNKDTEELVKDREDTPEEIECSCGGCAKQFNLKQNPQRWRYAD